MSENEFDIAQLILDMRAPDLTEKFIALHKEILDAKHAGTLSDALLNQCTDPECIVCGAVCCPHGELLHFHHDGCPACEQPPSPTPGATSASKL